MGRYHMNFLVIFAFWLYSAGPAAGGLVAEKQFKYLTLSAYYATRRIVPVGLARGHFWKKLIITKPGPGYIAGGRRWPRPTATV
jgi:hypothetical protein